MVIEQHLQSLYEPANSESSMIQSKLYMLAERTLFFAPLKHLEPHSYGAVILYVGLYGPFFLKIGNSQWTECSCAIVPAGVKHEIYLTQGILGKIFFEGNTRDYSFFCRKFSFRKELLLFYNKEVIDCFRSIYEQNMKPESINECIDKLIGFCNTAKFKLDPRIDKAIELIHSDISKNISEKFLANEVNLSDSRFRHLFHEQTGIAYRHYRVWKRLLFTAKELNSKDNLTFAALEAGFSDLSHFSKHYKNTFGVKPSYVFKNLHEFQLATTL